MDQLQPGQMLGPYRIINQIGQGGMATVYQAYQSSMDRNVAIKVLPSQLAESKEFIQRFQQEARIIAKLEHPHILPVFDYGESDGITYFVMRYLDAGTLSERMQKGRPLPLEEIDRLFTQLAEALSYAHGFGIIHRDLKPSNALIDSQGNLFLTDFGIAKLLESASPRLTQTDAIMGTPAYISPEQAQANKVNQRSDIYSLGIILYEMVTGRVPFVAETPLAVILKHVSEPLPPPSSLKPDIPEAIEKVVLRALEKQPEDRYATVSEFLSAWKRALDETKLTPRRAETPATLPETARTPSPPPFTRTAAPAPRAASNSRGWAGWAVGCLVGLCAIAVLGGAAFLFISNAANQTPTQTPIPTQTDAPVIPPTNTPRPTATLAPEPIGGEIIIDDDFSSSNWGTGTDTDSSVEYVNEALQIIVFTKNWFVWSTPDDQDYENIHMEVTVINNDTDPTTAFGLMCNQQTVTDQFYYFAITAAGQYAIAKTATGETDLFLTNNDQWEYSDAITANASSYRVGADCGNGTLALYVDGQLVDSVTDTTYTNGGVAVFAWSGEEATNTDVSFDDFLMTELP